MTRALSRESVSLPPLPPSPPLSLSPQKQKKKKIEKNQKQSLKNSVWDERAPVIAPAALGGSGDVACGHHGRSSGKKREGGEKAKSEGNERGKRERIERALSFFSPVSAFRLFFRKTAKSTSTRSSQFELKPASTKELAMRSPVALLVHALCAVACTSGEQEKE